MIKKFLQKIKNFLQKFLDNIIVEGYEDKNGFHYGPEPRDKNN